MLSLLLHPFRCLFGSTTTDETEHSHVGKDGAVGHSIDQAGAEPNAAADWPQLSSLSASFTASPKRKRGDLQAEADESLVSKYTDEPASGRKRPVLDPALISAEAFTLRSPSKTIPRTPVADTSTPGLDPLKGSDSFKFATPVITDAKTPIGGGVFLSSRAAAAAAAAAASPAAEATKDKMQPSKLALVPETQEEEKIKAQHSLSKTSTDAVQDEHTAKKLKPTDGSTNVETPLLNEKEKSRSKSVTPGFVVSASETDSPQVSGISNPATNFKEGKPVRVHGTPFETRMEKEIEREDLFTSGAKADFRGRLSDIVANQAMQLRSSPAPSNRTPWR